MIVKMTKEINGVEYEYTYSSIGMMIERDGVRYIEAYDPVGSNREYTETSYACSEIPAPEDHEISGDEFMDMIEEVL